MARSAFLGALLLSACSSGGPEPVPFDDGHSALAPEGTSAQRLDYPAPPYGARAGATIENFRFLGWENPKTARFDTENLERHSLAEFYDPDGSKGLHYLVMTSTAVWCSACKAEYQDMHAKVADYGDRGVRFMGALFEDNDSNPARPSDLQTWAKQFSVDFPFVLDPELKLGVFFDVQATPMVMIVDTKTMRIVSIDEGWASEGDRSVWAFLDSHLK